MSFDGNFKVIRSIPDGEYFWTVDDHGEPCWVKSPKLALRFDDDAMLDGALKRLRGMRFVVKATSKEKNWQ